MTRIVVSAGEPSGDGHTAAVVRELERRWPGCEWSGMGGAEMAAAGVTRATRMEDLSTIGFTSVLAKVPSHVRLLRAMQRSMDDGAVDLAFLTDYPGFNLRVARMAARRRVPVLYYIAPQLWAWREARISLLREAVTRLAVILPFEEAFFTARGVPTTYVGHPLLDGVTPSKDEARRVLGIPDGRPVLGLFPGSRRIEVRRMWPALREAALLVRRAVPEVEVLVAGMSGLAYPQAQEFRICRGDSAAVMAASDAALCKSGTITLAAALAGTPLLICYRTDALSFFLARRMVRCAHIGLVNLVAERAMVPEYIQSAMTGTALAEGVLPLLDAGGRAAREQRSGLADVSARLGEPGAARRVADLAAELVTC
ncbi:MAG: lipid-A-disaccharide synthase [Gemmatimonadetes bacterium]|nr:lipid-A-disaccharide synthase [Gemmatimonadota bacterium]